MSDNPPPQWDGLRAAFYLVALIIVLQVLGTLAAAGYCVIAMQDAIPAGKFECNKDGRLTELLNAALTAAVAFAMAFLNRGGRK